MLSLSPLTLSALIDGTLIAFESSPPSSPHVLHWSRDIWYGEVLPSIRRLQSKRAGHEPPLRRLYDGLGRLLLKSAARLTVAIGKTGSCPK